MENFFEQFLNNDFANPILVASIIGTGAFVVYLLKRKVERADETETIAQLHQAIDLKEKLDKAKLTIPELRSFRSEVLRNSANLAVQNAEYYVTVAQKLTDNAKEAEKEGRWPEAITQYDLNLRSKQEAMQADGALTRLVLDLMAGSDRDAADALQQAQTAWLIWRDAELQRERLSWRGGSIAPLMINMRAEGLTRERIASLEGDLLTYEGNKIPIKRDKTPGDLLDHVRPQVSNELVRQWLGTPHYIDSNVWHYRYEETEVQITFNIQEAVSAVVVALCKEHIYHGTIPAWGKFTLGQLSIGSILKFDDQFFVEYQKSLRTEELAIHIRTGPSGAWSECFFGALKIYSGAGHLMDVHFRWDPEADKLASNPDETLINWVGMCDPSEESPMFDWFIRQ